MNTNRPLNDFSQHIKNQFGERVQKITVDAGFTCPNRDGKISFGGCTYCNNKKFNPGREKLGETIGKQISTQIESIKKKYKNVEKYIVYFQAYSNTYSDVSHLEELYREALAYPGVIGLAIGTRPDCINEEILNLLETLAKDYYITIEYGLESMSDETLVKINRGHDVQCFIDAVRATQNRGIHICAHLIIGFPWENVEHYKETAIFLSKLSIDYLKIHQLEIVKNTIMGNEYLKNPFPMLSKDQYLNILCEFLSNLDNKIIVQRVAGDSPASMLIASGFHEKSSMIRTEIEKLMLMKNIYQGIKWQEAN